MYTEKEKNEARIKLISHAINCLSNNRKNSYLVTKKHVKTSYYDYFELLGKHYKKKDSSFDISIFSEKINKHYNNWEEHYNNKTDNKKVIDLKVLFLAGPNPINDLKVLLSKGISVHNIWAIEQDRNMYDLALESIKKNRLNIKLHKGSLKDFFSLNNEIFDIVYFDSCSPLISNNQDPLKVIKELLYNERLSELSALITNFSEIDFNCNQVGEIISSWYAWKDEDEFPPNTFDIFSENWEDNDIIKMSKKIEPNLLDIYSYFIPNFIGTISTEIIPMTKNINVSSKKDLYFNDKLVKQLIDKEFELLDTPVQLSKDDPSKIFEELFNILPDLYLSKKDYRLIHWSRYIKENINKDNPIYSFLFERNNLKFDCYTSIYFSTILQSFETSFSRYSKFYQDACNEDFIKILTSSYFADRRIGLSSHEPRQNLVVDLMIGIYGKPYIPNAQKHLSISYKAKTRRMFSDVFIFDKARYLYDFLPTFDLFQEFFSSIQNQILIHSCIDGIIRKSMTFNSNLFKYGFLNEPFNDFLKIFEIKKRKFLN